MAKGKSSGIFDSSGEERKKLRSSVGEEESIAYRKQSIELEKKEIKELQKRISLNKKSAALKKEEQVQLEKQLETVGKLSDEEYARYDNNEKFLKQLQSEEKILENRRKNLSRLKKAEADRIQSFEKLLSTNEELDDINTSIANKFGQQSKLAQKIGIITDQTLKTHKVSASIIDSMKDPNEKKRAIELNEAFKQRTTSIANASNEFAKRNISEEQYNDIIIESNKTWEDILSKMKLTSPEAKALVDTMKSATAATDGFYDSAKKSQKVLQGIDTLMGEFSGIPSMREFGEVIKNVKANSSVLKLSLFALGAAAAKFAYDYFGALDKIERAAPFQTQINNLEAQKQVIEKTIPVQNKGIRNQQIVSDLLSEQASLREQIFKAEWDAANAARRANLEFNAQIQQSALQFRTASKTALFGDKLGGVGYGAAQMEMAGVSADRVAEAIKTTGNVLGRMPTSRVASDMAVMAARTGATDESLASLAHMFMNIDGLSMSTALNMEDGLAAMAKSLNIPMDAFINEMAEASKEMLGYQIKSGPALAKQVAYAKSLGVSFSDIAKAGQNMVLNYKDSIKSEMQLSAMLGKQVDLSEVRSKFAMGDTKGALEALKAQGLNPAEMDMFQQQALQQATGMDLQTLRNIYTGEGRTGNLKEGNAEAGNRSFLGRVESAQREQAIGSANISANQAILSAKLEQEISSKYFKLIADSQSKMGAEYINILTEKLGADEAAIELDRMKNNAITNNKQLQGLSAAIDQTTQRMNLLQNVITTLIGVVGGAALMGVGSSLMKGKGGSILKNMMPSFGKKAAADIAPAPIVTKRGITLQRNVAGNIPTTSIASNAVKATEKVGIKSAEKIGMKSVGKLGISGLAKAGGKGLLKKIPGVGLIAGAGFAADRFKDGDYLGALGELASGVASTLPGIGTAVSMAIDAGLALKDMSSEAKSVSSDMSNGISANDISSNMGTASVAASADVSSNQIDILNSIQKNDHTRGVSMYKEMQHQSAQLRVLNTQSVKTFDRVHKANDNLAHLNNVKMMELININKNIQTLQEANVELMTLLVKHAQIPAEVTLDGKLVGKRLGDIYQSSRTITL